MSILGLEGLALSPRLPNISVSYEDFRMSQKTWRNEFVDICVSMENDDGQGQTGIWARLEAFLVKMKDLMVKMVHKVKDYCRQLLAIIAKYLVKFRNWYQTKKGFRPFKYTGYPIDTDILDQLDKITSQILGTGTFLKGYLSPTSYHYTTDEIGGLVTRLLSEGYEEHVVHDTVEAEALMKLAENLGEKAKAISERAYSGFNDFITKAQAMEKAGEMEAAKDIRQQAKIYYAVISKICMRLIRTMFSIVRHAKASERDLKYIEYGDTTYIPKEIQEAIKAGDVPKAREEIIKSLFVYDHDESPMGMRLALRTERFFRRMNLELFEPDNGSFSLPPKDEWNDETLNTIREALKVNFSKEKVRLHGVVGEVLSDKFDNQYEERKIREAIETNDRQKIREQILTDLRMEQSRMKYKAVARALRAEALCKEKGIVLFDKDDGRFRPPDRKKWTEYTLIDCMDALEKNFSIEKIRLADEILKELRKNPKQVIFVSPRS